MTARRIIFVGLWLLSLIAISFYGGNISYGFFFGMSLIPVVSAVYLLYVYFRFRIYQELSGRYVVCGQELPYNFILQNEDIVTFTNISVRLFSDFSYVEEVPDNISYEILPGEKFGYDTKLTCKYRGEYHVGVKEIIIIDLFGLFRIKYKMPSPIKAIVVPKIVKLDEIKSVPEIISFLQKEALAQEVEPDVTVRDYVPGDLLKRIHWKVTAREQKLKVRQVTGEEKQGIAILCETKRLSNDLNKYIPLENKILEVMLALSFFFAKSNTKVEMLYQQSDVTLNRVDGMGSFEAFYHEISNVRFSHENNIECLLKKGMECGSVMNSKAVFVILSELNDSIMEMIMELSSKGIIMVIYAITDGDISQYIRQSSIRLKIIAIPTEAELEGVL